MLAAPQKPQDDLGPWKVNVFFYVPDLQVFGAGMMLGSRRQVVEALNLLGSFQPLLIAQRSKRGKHIP